MGARPAALVVLPLLLLLLVPGVEGVGFSPSRYKCLSTAPAVLNVETVAESLNFPVALAVAPDGRIIFNELKSGRTRIIQNGTLLPNPFSTLTVATDGEQGLLGLALHPDFPNQPLVYVYHTYRDSANRLFNRVVSFKDQGNIGADMQVILDRVPAAIIHNSGILAFGPDGKLYVSVGDATQESRVQDTSYLNGKILRLNPDGTFPPDNPYPRSPVFALGFRNPFGMAFSPGGRLYMTDNGPDRNDEVNIVLPGGNYGWPDVTGFSSIGALTDPILNYTPTIAPTGIAFYTGASLRRDLVGVPFFGAWNTGEVRQIILNGCHLMYEDPVAHRAGSGILDMEMAVDGHLYFSTPGAIGRVVGPSVSGGMPLVTATAGAGLAAAVAPLTILAWGRSRTSGGRPSARRRARRTKDRGRRAPAAGGATGAPPQPRRRNGPERPLP